MSRTLAGDPTMRRLRASWLNGRIVALLVLSACVPSPSPTVRPGEVLVPGIPVSNDLAVPVQVTYERDGVEAPEKAKNLDTGILGPGELRDFLFDLYDSPNEDRCTRGIIRARAADGVVVAQVPAPRCLGKAVALSDWPPPGP